MTTDDIARLVGPTLASGYINFTRYTPPPRPSPAGARQMPLAKVFEILAANPAPQHQTQGVDDQ